jgi:serine/threonine protein phosphatase PrpC
VSFAFYVHHATDTGRERQHNEDAVEVSALPGGRVLLVLCDGMGGQEAGDVASKVALRAITGALHSAVAPWYKAIYQAFKSAQENVLRTAAERATPSMGTTAVCALLEGEQAWVGWIGDSRLYIFRSGEVVTRSADHTRVREMVERGILTAEQAKVHPSAHVLSRVIGGGGSDGFKPEVWAEPTDLVQGDVILLCSDGLYDLLSDEEIYATIAELDYTAAPQALIDAANSRGGFDNISVALAVVGTKVVPKRQVPEKRELPATMAATPFAETSGAAGPQITTPAAAKPAPVSAPADSPRTIRISSRWLLAGTIALSAVLVALVGYLLSSNLGRSKIAASVAPPIADAGTGH